jgi:hypothetical protein
VTAAAPQASTPVTETADPIVTEPAAAPAGGEAPIGSDEWLETHAQWLANHLDRDRIFDLCNRAVDLRDQKYPLVPVEDDEPDDDPPPRRKRKPPKVEETTIGAAVNAAYAEWQGLAEEIREVVDNSEAFSATQRIQTLDETANTLESLEEPKVADELVGIKVSFGVCVTSSSRSTRCSNATTALEACIEALTLDEGDPRSAAANDLREELQNAVDETQCCDFPGMYG